jgi:hypothetical protein
VSTDCNERAYPHVNKLRGFVRTSPELLSSKTSKPDNKPITTGFALYFSGVVIACKSALSVPTAGSAPHSCNRRAALEHLYSCLRGPTPRQFHILVPRPPASIRQLQRGDRQSTEARPQDTNYQIKFRGVRNPCLVIRLRLNPLIFPKKGT